MEKFLILTIVALLVLVLVCILLLWHAHQLHSRREVVQELKDSFREAVTDMKLHFNAHAAPPPPPPPQVIVVHAGPPIEGASLTTLKESPPPGTT